LESFTSKEPRVFNTAIIQRYLAALEGKDYGAARSFLADDFTAVRPSDSFDNADAYVAALKKAGSLLEHIDVKRMFHSGREVVVLCDLIMSAPAPAKTFVTEWYTLDVGRIVSVRVLFDTRPFASKLAEAAATLKSAVAPSVERWRSPVHPEPYAQAERGGR
jgi:hypothetical protein